MTTAITNHELLQEYIENCEGHIDIVDILKKIQSRLISPVEYEIGKKYGLSDDRQVWHEDIFGGYSDIDGMAWNYIRPIDTSSEVSSAITLLEATGEYKITKL